VLVVASVHLKHPSYLVDWHQASHLVFMELVIPFLFSFNPKSVFKWTARNNYNQLCEGGRIALGGGGQEANFGLCIEDCFRKGSSGNCETYNNLPLAGDNNEFFDILAFEVYGFENPW
jgi:hypothetical protein